MNSCPSAPKALDPDAHGPPGNGKTINIKAMMHMLYKRGKEDDDDSLELEICKMIELYQHTQHLGQPWIWKPEDGGLEAVIKENGVYPKGG